MRSAPTSCARLWAMLRCAVPAVAGVACARHPAPATVPARVDTLAPAGQGPAVALHVTNSNWSDVRIYIVRGRLSLRLGLVTSNSSADFEIPPDFINAAGSTFLIAAPIGGRTNYSVALPGLAPGDALELTVAAFLQYSSLVVR